MRIVCRTQSGTSARGISATGRAGLQHELGHEALEVGEQQQVGAGSPGATAPSCVEAVPERRAERRADERVLGRDAEGDASRTIELM